MGFLSGPMTFDRFRVAGTSPKQFAAEHLKALKRLSIEAVAGKSSEEIQAGFLAGDHLFDQDFSLEKNVIGDALHFAIRVDTNQVPAAIRKAWTQIELAAILAQSDKPDARPTKLQRQEAREAVESRCEQAIGEGKYRRMQQFPLLWDARGGIVYLGSGSSTAAEHARDLLERAFDLELERVTAGRKALDWATEAKQRKALEDVTPAGFLADGPAEIAWWNQEADNYDFLGNEFLLWLWWRWETQSDTLELPDKSEVTGMFARTLALQCPRDESGRETISAEGPTGLPEAALAIRSGKLPRRAGLTLVRYGRQFDLVLQAETFTVGGAKVQTDDQAEGRAILEDRIEALRELGDTIDLLFQSYCQRRVGKHWAGELEGIRRWLKKGK